MVINKESTEVEQNRPEGFWKRILAYTCLKPTWTLRTQLFCSFGILSVFAIGSVMIVAISTAASTGKNVKAETNKSLQKQANNTVGSSSRYMAETVEQKLSNFDRISAIIVEVARDRFAGYPDHPEFMSDRLVPFMDSDTGVNMYPLNSSDLLPLDWQIIGNVNDQNAQEHLNDRYSWYVRQGQGPPVIGTDSASYRQQGACDPNQANNEFSPLYYPGCTDVNNDLTTGGVVRPTDTNMALAQKSKDLNFLFKPFYETNQDVFFLGIFFANSGAGSSVTYPAFHASSNDTYESIGCDWMSNRNPMTASFSSATIGTAEEIAQCHPAGQIVKGRDFNPLEREWCMAQALDPSRMHSVGPYKSAWKDNLWIMTYGRSIYDRVTNNFIGCVGIIVTITDMVNLIQDSKVGETSEVSLVRWSDGTVVASSLWDPNIANGTAKVYQTNFGMGIDKEKFDSITQLVDFSSYWEPKEVQTAFEVKAIFEVNNRIFSAYPIPTPPKEYSETYRPEFMVIVSIEKDELFQSAKAMGEKIDEDVSILIRSTLIVGFSGLAVVCVVLFLVAHHLTTPLAWVECVANKIVKNAGEGLNDDILYSPELSSVKDNICTPKTEITKLVHEFQTMVKGFSGSGTAIVVRDRVKERVNHFRIIPELYTLYWEGVNERAGDAVEGTPCRQNLERHVIFQDETENIGPTFELARKVRVCRSRLFWWIIFLLVTPMILSMVIISLLVSKDMKRELPTWLEDVKSMSARLEILTINNTAFLRAIYAEELIKKPISDLHVLSRIAGWLFFGALERSDSFTTLVTGTEDCKAYMPDATYTCPFLLNTSLAPCDCSWNNPSGVECQIYEDIDSRYLQRQFYSGQSQDVDEFGTRRNTSYPAVAATPTATSFWNNVNATPGSSIGKNASGYTTTYDRLRVVSALSVIQIPLHNYYLTDQNQLGTYIGFDADGMLTGYAGCDYSQTGYASWRSDDASLAYLINPDLCPKGKYGYDSRCREWYDDGKKSALSGMPLHISPPYVFASNSFVGLSSTLPLVDPSTGEYVGTVMIDFLPQSIIDSLASPNTRIGQGTDGFPILVTPFKDVSGANTVVGPGFHLDGPGKAIDEVVLPNDGPNSQLRVNFREYVLPYLNGGEANVTSFQRRDSRGEEETIYIAYVPIMTKVYKPIDPRDFSRGVNVTSSMVFALGIAIPETDLALPFTRIIQSVNQDISKAFAILISLIVIAGVLSISIATSLTSSIVNPVLKLLGLVQSINSRNIQYDLPKLSGGCKEVTGIYGTFEKLYTVIKFSNASFYAGDPVTSYRVLSEALSLFEALKNNKAIGICSNNLGNTMLSIYDQVKKYGTIIDGFDEPRYVVQTGLGYIEHAITSAEEELSLLPEDSADRHAYVQQLANRYFNKAMILYLCRYEGLEESYSDKAGLNLAHANSFDYEAQKLRESKGLQIEGKHFDLLLSRSRGLIRIHQSGINPTNNYDLQEIFDKMRAMITGNMPAEECAMNQNDNSLVFMEVGRVGRIQQLEGVKMSYLLNRETPPQKSDIDCAARIALRMLVEDEYCLSEEQAIALKALTLYCESEGTANLNDILPELYHMSPDVPSVKSVVFCLDRSGSMMGGKINTAIANLLTVFDFHCNDWDYVGFVKFDHEVEPVFPLRAKRGNSDDMRSRIMSANNARGGTMFYSALGRCVDLYDQHEASMSFLPGPKFIVALTDGESHDRNDTIIQRLMARRPAQKIHIIIVGVEVNSNVIHSCREVCATSEKSMYIDAGGGLKSIDEAFEKVVKIITGGGVTMETF